MPGKVATVPIPSLNAHGLLPTGVHDCTLPEIEQAFTWNDHRKQLLTQFRGFYAVELRALFSDPVFFDGSFVTDKANPADIDVALDLRMTDVATQWRGFLFMQTNQPRLASQYAVHFWVNLQGQSDFSAFFQYLGLKNAHSKGLSPNDHKGILRLL